MSLGAIVAWGAVGLTCVPFTVYGLCLIWDRIDGKRMEQRYLRHTKKSHRKRN